MRKILVSVALLGLTACGTPQQQCISGVTRDLTIVNRLIAEVEGNLSRGYTYEDVVQTTPQFVDCTPDPTPKRPEPRPRQCLVNVSETVSRPAAIDLQAESAKLASLRAKRSELSAAASPAIAACQRQYPQ